jgi:A/G-specific adenine glycosylase
MTIRHVAYGLCLRTRRGRQQILLRQRPAIETVMTGMWELPSLTDFTVPAEHLRLTVRHAIMQVNYVASIRDVAEHEVAELATEATAERRWVPLEKVALLPLTGLARKVLARTHLLMDATRKSDA